MGVTTIAWANFTFNPWIGCTKISKGCQFCYASVDTYARVSASRGLPLWGPWSTRHRTSTANWRKPLAWNRAARLARLTALQAALPYERPRVFCASLCDVFEAHPSLDAYRADLRPLIEKCTELDWMLLTKRPENIMKMVPDAWRKAWPAHVWIGTSVEDQRAADERIPRLLEVPARVRFLSMEPLLEAVDLAGMGEAGMSPSFLSTKGADGCCTRCALPWWYEDPRVATHPRGHTCPPGFEERNIHLVIVGGESGSGARPFDLAWPRSIRDKCRAAGVPFFMKQLGAMPRIESRGPTAEEVAVDQEKNRKRPPRRRGHLVGIESYLKLKDKKGGDFDEPAFPADLRIREMPEVIYAK